MRARLAWALLPVWLVCFDTRAQAAGAADLFDNPIRATGKNFEIRQNEVDEMVVGLKATLSATRSQSIPDAQRGQVAAQMLDRLVLLRALALKATEADKARAREVADKFVANTRSNARSEEAYRRQLLAAGIKPEVFEARALDQALMEVVLDREIKSRIEVTDTQVAEFYDSGIDPQARHALELLARTGADQGTNSPVYQDLAQRIEALKKSNLARLDHPEQVKAQVIVVHTIDRLTREEMSDADKTEKERKIEKARTRIRNGEDFSTVAREVSEDPDVAKNGGEYRTLRDAVVFPELRAVLFNLPIGELSDVIVTRAGLYLIKVLERTPAGKMPRALAEKEIRDYLLGQEVQQRLPAYFDQLKKEFEVVYLGTTNTPAAK